jgi:hypothetical protein
MKKNTWINILLALLLLTAAACKTKKTIAYQPSATSSEKSDMAQLMDADLMFSTFNTKAKATITFDTKAYDLVLNIRIKRNDTIWVSASYFGIEAGRILITPDTIKVLDRIQARYLIKPFGYLEKFVNPKVNFSVIQSILVGNTMEFWYRKESNISKDTSGYTVKGQKQDLNYRAKFNTLTKVINTLLIDTKTGQQLQVNYANFIPTDKANIPTQVLLKTTASQKDITADMLYSTPQLNKILEYPFTIPKRFTVIE